MRDLEVPFALAGLQIDAHQAVSKQVVPRPVPAVKVRRGVFHGQVNQAELFINRDLRPHAGVAVDGPRLVLPGVVAELAGTGNRVERPEHFAALHVEGTDQALGVVVGPDRHAFLERRADDDDVLDDSRGRMEADLAGLQIDLLSLPEHRALLHVDDAAFAEGRNHRAVPGVEGDQAVAGRHVEDALVALAVGPVRHAAARQLARRDRGAVALAVAVRPDQFTGASVERDDGSACARGRIEHASDRERSAFELELGARAEVVGLEAPRDLELVEVGRVDLIERRILRAPHVRRVVRPVAVSGARHRAALGRRADGHPDHAGSEHGHDRHGAFHCVEHVVS